MAMNDELYNDKDPFILHIVDTDFHWMDGDIDFGAESSDGFLSDPLTLLERREECELTIFL